MSDDAADVTRIEFQRGVAALVTADEVRVRQAGAGVIVSRGDLSIDNGGGQLMLAGGDVSIREGGAQTVLAKGQVSVEEGGALVMAGSQVTAREAMVGVALGGRVELTDSRVLLGPKEAAVLGAAAGVVFAVVKRLLDRRD